MRWTSIQSGLCFASIAAFASTSTATTPFKKPKTTAPATAEPAAATTTSTSAEEDPNCAYITLGLCKDTTTWTTPNDQCSCMTQWKSQSTSCQLAWDQDYAAIGCSTAEELAAASAIATATALLDPSMASASSQEVDAAVDMLANMTTDLLIGAVGSPGPDPPATEAPTEISTATEASASASASASAAASTSAEPAKTESDDTKPKNTTKATTKPKSSANSKAMPVAGLVTLLVVASAMF